MSALILVIEDDAASLDLMIYLLTAHGYRTASANRGDDGLTIARRCRPDLILCDIHLPGLDGYSIASALKTDESLRSTPLIAVTALAMVGDRDRVLAAGFDAYVAKPIDPDTFIQQIEPLLKSHRGHRVHVLSAISVATPRPTTRCGTLLVVDDTLANLELKRSIFEPFGYRVLTADTVAGALGSARKHRPTLIISDIGLPDASGFELLRQLKADPDLTGIPVVVITATHADAATRAMALRLGACRFLLRPLDAPEVLREVESCLFQMRGGPHGQDPRH